MAMSAALLALGTAFQDEVQREVSSLRKEVEHEREYRLLLEQQVSKLQQAVYSNAEVDAIFDSLRAHQEQQAETVKAQGAVALRAAQRELEQRIESTLQNLQP